MKETITGGEAIARMRMVSKVEGLTFGMVFVGCDYRRRETTGIHKVENARLRPALKKETFQTANSDMYLPYFDMDAKEARMCFKKLIRMVAFPPRMEWMDVKWFE